MTDREVIDGDIDFWMLAGFLNSLRKSVPEPIRKEILDGFDDVLAKSGLTDKGGLIGLMENPTRGIVHRELV